MKRFIKKICKSASVVFAQIHLVDKCLIILMLVLLIQSGHNLFANSSNNQDLSNIDVIIRTSSASIFGYFLSVNFIKRNRQQSNTENLNVQTVIMDNRNQNSEIKNEIGFTNPSQYAESEGIDTKLTPLTSNNNSVDNRIQIIIATIIGVFSLTILIMVRNFSDMIPNTSSFHSTISQFRDFVSGCVGFLIGSAKNS